MKTLTGINALRRELNQQHKLCVFGVGRQLQEHFSHISLFLGAKPDYFCDNNSGLWGKTFFDVPCISPDDLHGMVASVTVVITIRDYFPVYQQIQKMGIKNIYLLLFEKSNLSVFDIKSLSKERIPYSVDRHSRPSLKGRWALVTGASRGIGMQIALALAGYGVNIIAHSRSVSHNKEVADRCALNEVEILSVEADFQNPKEIRNMLAEIDRSMPPIDFIFNNAGISGSLEDVWSADIDDYLNKYRVNTMAPVSIANHFFPLMLKRGFGRIVFTSSTIEYRPHEMPYALSKAALDKYVHDITPLLRGKNVLSSLLDPGWLRTDMGGDQALFPVESVVPGALLGVALNNYKNGQWFFSQDYSGLSFEEAIEKSKFLLNLS